MDPQPSRGALEPNRRNRRWSDQKDHERDERGEPVVLLVDDDEDSRLIYRTILRQAGFEVVTVGDGLAALTVANLIEPSVIVLDIGLPTLDGIDVLKAIRQDERLCAIPVISVTGRAMVHEQPLLRDAGFDDVLLKPVEPAVVLRAVQAQLDRAPAW
jgi:DNA-binding response OmpR family regulator